MWGYAATCANFCLLLLVAVLCFIDTRAATCQKDPDPPPNCPETYEEMQNPAFCLRFSSKRLPWMEARRACQEEGADLYLGHTITIMGQLETHITTNYSSTGGIDDGFWIGLQKESTGRWRWLTKDLENKEMMFERWSTAVGINVIGFDCALARKDAGRLVWEAANCLTRHVFFCQRARESAECSTGWVEISELQMCVKDFWEASSFAEARAACEAVKSELFTIRNADENDIINDFYENTRRYWIGLSRENGSDRFHWINNHPLLDNFYKFYMHRRQGVLEAHQRCMVNSRGTTFFAADCGKSQHFVCQKVSANGPTLPNITIAYPASGSTLFIGQTAEVTCTSRNLTTNMSWSVRTENKYDLVSSAGAIITQKPARLVENGKCVDVVVSTYRFLVMAKHDKSFINCFNYQTTVPGRQVPWCLNSRNPLAFCAQFQLRATEEPTGPTTISPVFDKLPNIAYINSTLTVFCSGYPAADRPSVVWVIFSEKPPVVLEANHSEIWSTKTIKEKDGRTLVTSLLKMTPKPAFHGSSIACFSYSVRGASKCLDKDMYCAATPPIRVIKSPKDAAFRSGLNIHGIALFLLFVLLTIFGLIVMFSEKEERNYASLVEMGGFSAVKKKKKSRSRSDVQSV